MNVHVLQLVHIEVDPHWKHVNRQRLACTRPFEIFAQEVQAIVESNEVSANIESWAPPHLTRIFGARDHYLEEAAAKLRQRIRSVRALGEEARKVVVKAHCDRVVGRVVDL